MSFVHTKFLVFNGPMTFKSYLTYQCLCKAIKIKAPQNTCVPLCIHVQSLQQTFDGRFDVAIYPHDKLEIISKICSANSLMVPVLKTPRYFSKLMNGDLLLL